jgi:hypothetical protein
MPAVEKKQPLAGFPNFFPIAKAPRAQPSEEEEPRIKRESRESAIVLKTVGIADIMAKRRHTTPFFSR